MRFGSGLTSYYVSRLWGPSLEKDPAVLHLPASGQAAMLCVASSEDTYHAPLTCPPVQGQGCAAVVRPRWPGAVRGAQGPHGAAALPGLQRRRGAAGLGGGGGRSGAAVERQDGSAAGEGGGWCSHWRVDMGRCNWCRLHGSCQACVVMANTSLVSMRLGLGVAVEARSWAVTSHTGCMLSCTCLIQLLLVHVLTSPP